MTRIGEIIETSTVGFWAESVTLHDLPPLGALVDVTVPGGDTLYGVVAFGQTGGVDPGRRAVRRGSEEVFDEAIYRQHPELTRILRTTFRVATVGYAGADGRPKHHLPPCPPPLHYSVSRCDAAAVRRFTAEPRYFAILATGEGEVAPEQLLAAHIRAIYVDRGCDDDWLALAGRQVARQLKRDYDRLLTVLEAIDPGGWSAAPRPAAAPAPVVVAPNGHNGHGARDDQDDFSDVPF